MATDMFLVDTVRVLGNIDYGEKITNFYEFIPELKKLYHGILSRFSKQKSFAYIFANKIARLEDKDFEDEF